MTAPEKLGKLHPPFTEPVGDGLYDDAGMPNDDGLYDAPRAGVGDRWTPLFYPPAAPAPRGLLDAVTWIQDGTTPLRFLEGLQLRQSNFGLSGQFGIWDEDWCVDPDDLTSDKIKARPDAVTSDIEALTVYAYDSNQCGDMTVESRREVRARAIQTMRMHETIAVEISLGARMLAEAPTPVTASSVTAAVSQLEAEVGKYGLTGALHASHKWAAYLVDANLNVGGRSPMGHTWVFGGGYTTSLGDTIVATTPVYGWRGPMMVRDAIKHELNQYVVVAERSQLVAYEAAIAAVTVTV